MIKSLMSIKKIAATVAVTGMMLLSNLGAIAQTALRDGDTVNGFIRTNCLAFRFRNESRVGSPLQSALGDEYTLMLGKGILLILQSRRKKGAIFPR
jgi:hypothetical protein